MSIPSRVPAGLSNVEVSIAESGGETSMLFIPGLDDETVEEAKASLQNGNAGWEDAPGRWEDVIHSDDRDERIATLFIVKQGSFGRFRHQRSGRVLDAVGTILGESGIAVDTVRAPKDFSSRPERSFAIQQAKHYLDY